MMTNNKSYIINPLREISFHFFGHLIVEIHHLKEISYKIHKIHDLA
jgi:hypothetical protein